MFRFWVIHGHCYLRTVVIGVVIFMHGALGGNEYCILPWLSSLHVFGNGRWAARETIMYTLRESSDGNKSFIEFCLLDQRFFRSAIHRHVK